MFRCLTDAVEEGNGGGFGGGVELSAEEVGAETKLVEGLGALAEPHIALHDEAVGILAAGVQGQQPPAIVESIGVIALGKGVLRQAGQQRQMAHVETLALDQRAQVASRVQAASVEVEGAAIDLGCGG